MLQSKYTGFTQKLNYFSGFTTVVCNICHVLNVSIKKNLTTFSNEANAKIRQLLKGYQSGFCGCRYNYTIIFIFILANLFSVSLEALLTNKTITTHNSATSKHTSEEETNQQSYWKVLHVRMPDPIWEVIIKIQIVDTEVTFHIHIT